MITLIVIIGVILYLVCIFIFIRISYSNRPDKDECKIEGEAQEKSLIQDE